LELWEGLSGLAYVCNLAYLNLKILRAGQDPIDGREFSCHDKVVQMA